MIRIIHLIKLLTTIAAVLISVSAYSQDNIEYYNGTFTQNGVELSLEQITVLTVLHKAGRGNVRKGNRFDRMYKDGDLRMDNNGLNALGGVATGFCGGIGILVVAYTEVGWIYRDASEKARYVLGVGTMIGLCVVSYKAFSRIALSPEGCLRKRDKEFNKVADKLNEAMKASNQ
ncbi:hypothetical protein OAQ90_00405 [Schleiferiaceae bacterium]|nr:hypothetical protein [Schleiferiaceae bacterium]